MCAGSEHSAKFQLRPAKLPCRPDIPCLLLDCQLCLQNDYVLRPANGHSFGHHREVAFIGAVKFPHPPQVPGRETRNVRICTAQILRCGNGGAFLWPAADQPTNLTVQFHLRQIGRHQRAQRCKHVTIVYILSDVHRFLLSSAGALISILCYLKLPRSKPSAFISRACSLRTIRLPSIFRSVYQSHKSPTWFFPA